MKRPLTIILLFLLMIVAAAYLWWRSSEPKLSSAELAFKRLVPANPVADQQDIYEAVFRYRLAQRGYKGTYFLDVNGVDPTDDFLARFRGCGALVKKASGSYMDKNSRSIRDKSTGDPGVVLFVSGIVWMSSHQADVVGGSQCGGLCLDSGVYRLDKRNGKWFVEHYQIQAIALLTSPA